MIAYYYKKWDDICKRLVEMEHSSYRLDLLLSDDPSELFYCLKHDVETDVRKALKLAEIEAKRGIRGTYYVQGYLLKKSSNISILRRIAELGHEVSYHYDVLDSAKGNFPNAIQEFDFYKNLFESNGFVLRTVCQHGNPLIERNGYHSNRDFFRDDETAKKYNGIVDVVVDLSTRICQEYSYISDAGFSWKIIGDVERNDMDSSSKNFPLDSHEALISYVQKGNSVIISTHPHRWTSSATRFYIKYFAFKVIRFIGKTMYRIPGVKSIMNRFYYLAKKI